MSHELGRLEDLPQDYRDDLTQLNLVPLWPSLRAVLPPKVPTRKTRPTFWSYQSLRPGQTLRLPARSPAMVFHQIEGRAEARIEDSTFTLSEADTCCTPGYTAMTLHNLSAEQPAFLFIADETPLHQKLGVFENRG